MKLGEVIDILESFAPLDYQEHYDNSGLAVGDPEREIRAALLCIDVTLPIIEEAVRLGADLIISHHPVIFGAIKQLTWKSNTEKIIINAVKENIAIYSAHTNLDNISEGVNRKICEKIGLVNTRILFPLQNNLKKLVTFVPLSHAEAVRNALFSAGAGHIGNYDACSYNLEGKGSFRALEGANPFAGEVGKMHFEDEVRIETVFPAPEKNSVIKALILSHPYEEVAYDIYPVENTFEKVGSGMIGDLVEEMDATVFLTHIKKVFGCAYIRHSMLSGKPIKKIAVCGGSGSFLIQKAISAGADLFLTGEMKYHQFFDSGDQIIVADIGHFESEKFTIEIFYDILRKKIPNFAIHFSTINSSPIYYI